jgi:putative endonuclease
MFSKSNYCYVYMVCCSNGSFYTGITKNLRKRILQHNGLAWGGARYTRSHRPVVLVHVEKYNSRKEAARREFEIKEMTHDQKQELVSRTTKDQILSAI